MCLDDDGFDFAPLDVPGIYLCWCSFTDADADEATWYVISGPYKDRMLFTGYTGHEENAQSWIKVPEPAVSATPESGSG
jgi:hypothetical protein